MKKTLAWSALLLSSITGCGETLTGVQSPQTGCSANAVLILVGDGFVQNFCGCQEASGTLATSGQNLTCTFAVGKTVIFQYQPGRLHHQIIPVGTPAIIDGPVYDPNASVPIRSFSHVPAAAGTYRFQDSFNTAVSGQLVVQ
ncbi:MAG: hypothetical protein AB7P04_12620 [Bacteriovoracia bacterium]